MELIGSGLRIPTKIILKNWVPPGPPVACSKPESARPIHTMTTAPKRRWPRYTLRTLFVAVTVVGILASWAALTVRYKVMKEQAVRLTREDGLFMTGWLLDDIGWESGDDLPAIRLKLDRADTQVYIATTPHQKDADVIERTLREKGIECGCSRSVKILPSYTDYAVTVRHRDAKRARNELRSAPLNMLPITFLPLDIIVQEQ
jgi:hypothetical protein